MFIWFLFWLMLSQRWCYRGLRGGIWVTKLCMLWKSSRWIVTHDMCKFWETQFSVKAIFVGIGILIIKMKWLDCEALGFQFYNEDPFIDKTASLYWNSPQIARFMGSLHNMLRLRQNGRHVFDFIFLNENFCIMIQISLKFVLVNPIGNKSTFAQIMAWYWIGSKPLSGPMIT